MATEQCYYALVASKRFEERKTALFDMKDVKANSNDEMIVSERDKDVNIPDIKNPGKSFADIEGHEKREIIEALAAREIINGKHAFNFAPEKTMTRADFACIMVRALGLPMKMSDKFCDVSSDSWYYQYVNTACVYKIISGVSANRFNPDGVITFEQACAMIERSANLCGIKNNYDAVSQRNILSEFTDYICVAEWAKASVAFCFGNNIADGSVVKINPGKAVVRWQIADMLYNLLEEAELL